MPAALTLIDQDGRPIHRLDRVWDCEILHEVNGEHLLSFTMLDTDSDARLVTPEARVRIGEDSFRIVNVKQSRGRDGRPLRIVTEAEADFYELGRRQGVTAHQWNDSQARDELISALDGTGWGVGQVSVTSRATWAQDTGSPLEVLRSIAKTHGGDLTFNPTTHTVSLLATMGTDTGVFFATGRNITSLSKTLDTSQLVTRLHAATEDGQTTFASINGGHDYLENHTYTQAIADGYLTFKNGTSPYEMLRMTNVSLGKYCKPRTTYQVEVADLSFLAGHEIEQLALGDQVTIWDPDIGINSKHKVVAITTRPFEPWKTKLTLDSTLRQLGSSDSTNAGILTTGAQIDTRNLVPFNLLQNARFDNGLAHWASSGAEVVDGGVTGRKAIQFAGSGTRWIQQTVACDTRNQYTLSMQVATSGFDQGVIPALTAEATITYTDGSSETIQLTLV
jgi:phage minor structural protein